MFVKTLAITVLAASAAIAAPTGQEGKLVARQEFSGVASYYDVGLGNCGHENGGWEFVVAINAPQWAELGGTPAGGGPCDRGVTITDTTTGQTFNAAVVDQCPGCAYGDLDLSRSLFTALHYSETDGRFPITWHFN